MTQSRFVITIARQEGSGGTEIARELARKLKLTYFDKEALRLAAVRLGFAEDDLARLDDKGTPELKGVRQRVAPPVADFKLSQVLVPDRTEAGIGYKTPTLLPLTTVETPATREQASIQESHHIVEWLIKEVAEQGRAVIVGRAANLVLKDWPGVVNIFIHAPLTQRIERLAYQQHLDHEVAGKIITETDQNRAEYVRQYYGPDWTNPDLYDLVVNTAKLSLPVAAAAISQYVRELDQNRAVKDPLALHQAYERLAAQESYTLKEAAELLLLSPDLLIQAVYRGELKAANLNHRVTRISREALADWLHRSTPEAVSVSPLNHNN
jgi:excisionase family DNA binding protein